MEAPVERNPWQPVLDNPFVKRFVPELAVWSWVDPMRAQKHLAGIQRATLDLTIETLEQVADLLRQVRDRNAGNGGTP